MSTQAPKMRPLATLMNLSHGSVCTPRVTPRRALWATLCCTGPKSGSPSAVIFARCQFSLNQPRLSSCSGSRTTSSPGIEVFSTDSSVTWLPPSNTESALVAVENSPSRHTLPQLLPTRRRSNGKFCRLGGASLALGRAEGLGGLLVGTPPVLVPAVPVDG